MRTRWKMVAVMTAMSSVSFGMSTSKAAANPIDHVVVLMQENRSADNYFALLHDQGQSDFEAQPAGASNPDPTNPAGAAITPFHQTKYCESADVNHSWTGAHEEFNGGAMDGFTKANVDPTDPTGRRAMGYYDKTDLPYYNTLYNTFATGDRFFSSVLGPTYPNRFYLYAGTSFGHITNDLAPVDGFTQRTVLNTLDEAKVSWRVYFEEIPFVAEFKYGRDNAAGHLFPMAQFYADSAAGTLPQVAFLDPAYIGSQNTQADEHPPANIQTGQQFVSRVVTALTNSPVWSSAALFLTYDEDGGYYDHVAPPSAPIPDGIAPMLKAGDVDAQFDRYGFRVPVAVVSPFAKAHFVSHVVHDHTSILRFIEMRFGLPALTNRDGQADPMLEFFDFSHPVFATPPPLPLATIDPAHALECQANESGTPSLEP